MGKKNDTATPAAAIAVDPASNQTTNSALEDAGVLHSKRAAARPAVKKNPAKAKPKKAQAAKKRVTFSTEDIALRAYYISEHRQRNGVHGDALSDWIEAKRQLQAESRKKIPLSNKRG